jgi:hypothetical protein
MTVVCENALKISGGWVGSLLLRSLKLPLNWGLSVLG